VGFILLMSFDTYRSLLGTELPINPVEAGLWVGIFIW